MAFKLTKAEIVTRDSLAADLRAAREQIDEYIDPRSQCQGRAKRAENLPATLPTRGSQPCSIVGRPTARSHRAV